MGVGDSKIKDVFNKFDKDHSGMLTLDNLLTIQNIPGLEHPVTHSPILLYKVILSIYTYIFIFIHNFLKIFTSNFYLFLYFYIFSSMNPKQAQSTTKSSAG